MLYFSTRIAVFFLSRRLRSTSLGKDLKVRTQKGWTFISRRPVSCNLPSLLLFRGCLIFSPRSSPDLRVSRPFLHASHVLIFQLLFAQLDSDRKLLGLTDGSRGPQCLHSLAERSWSECNFSESPSVVCSMQIWILTRLLSGLSKIIYLRCLVVLGSSRETIILKVSNS